MVLTVAARVVGDAGGAQLREASLTSAAVPAGALTAQAVLVTSVGRHQHLLRSEEKAPLHGVSIPEPPSIYSQAQPWSPWRGHSRHALSVYHSCSASLLQGEGKSSHSC